MISLHERSLKLAFLKLPHPDEQHIELYRKALDCWAQVWGHLFEEFQVNQQVFMDAFLRQDEAACLFYRDECIGMILFRTLDFDLLDYSRDSYFKDWTEADLNNLLMRGKKVFIASYMTVHPDYRHTSPELNFKFKELFMEIMVRRFLESGADVISGIARRDRGMHDESYKMGAHLIRENMDYMGGKFKVDLVGFYRNAVQHSPIEPVRAVAESLWRRKIDLPPHHASKKAA